MKEVSFKIILSIETSCDDTSVALVDNTGLVLGMKSQNQDDVHGPFGGVIPELACRNHTMRILPLLDLLLSESKISWAQIDGIAVTNKPGLIGALLVGVTVAQSLALLHDIPLIGVNHLEGHLHAPFLKDASYSPKAGFDYPFIGLCVSGGHTSLYEVKGLGEYALLGRTLDDAAGEAFDKFGKLVGLGYPAGAKVDGLARLGRKDAYVFPRALMKKNDLNFSFSGLKTAGALKLTTVPWAENPQVLHDLCASYQEAIVEALVEKTKRALAQRRLKRVVITGGVSANSRLREVAEHEFTKAGVEIQVPPLRYCTDNAAMIGLVGVRRLNRGEKSPLSLEPQASVSV